MATTSILGNRRVVRAPEYHPILREVGQAARIGDFVGEKVIDYLPASAKQSLQHRRYRYSCLRADFPVTIVAGMTCPLPRSYRQQRVMLPPAGSVPARIS